MQPEIIIIIAAVIALVVASIVTYKVTVSKLSKNADSKIGNAESRAREIIDGSEPMVAVKNVDKPLTVAIDEMNQSKIRISGEDEE